MQAKGVIRKQVQWAESRTFFYWRLRRRLTEFQCANDSGDMHVAGARKEVVQKMKSWFLQQGGHESDWEDDRGMVTWFETHDEALKQFIAGMKCNAQANEIASKLSALAGVSNRAGDDKGAALRAALKGLSGTERAQLLEALR
jgi:acetyl-CoA carboxylase/biotin carboxylase 1